MTPPVPDMVRPVIQYLIDAGGLSTRVLDARPSGDVAADRTVVFVHGLGARSDRFRRNLTGLASAGYRGLALDLPGHGLAQKGVLPYSVPFFARFLNDALDELELERVSFVATSLGAHIAARAALDQPDRVNALVLVGAVGLVRLGSERRELLARSILDRSHAATAAKLGRLLRDPALLTNDLIDEEHRINTSPGADEAAELLSAYFRGVIDDHVLGEDLARSDLVNRLLLVWGAEDRSIPLDIGYQGRDLLRAPPLAILRDTGHAPYFERPETFSRIVEEFLTGKMEGPDVRTY